MSPACLDGVRVLDLTRLFAGPFGGQLLGDFGAEVIRVEKPGRPPSDGARLAYPKLHTPDGELTDEAASYVALNRNKRGITANIAAPAGQQLVRELAAKCDVLLENYKVGDLVRYGLDYESIRKINPGIIYCSITAFGQTGPDRSQLGTDPVFQGRSGWAALTGYPESESSSGPILVGAYLTDLFGGCYAAMSVLAALRHRDRTGAGQQIDLSLFDVAIATTSHTAQEYLVSGQQKPRMGGRIPAVSPGGVMPCNDGFIIAMPGPNQIEAFMRVLGLSEMLEDSRFAGMQDRVVNRDQLEPAVFERTRQWTRDELVAALNHADCPAGPINEFKDVFSDPQALARDMLVKVEHPTCGEIGLVGSPVKFSETPVTRYLPPPLQGQHTDEILREVLGKSDAEIAALREAGAL
jgi:crotonobetainyl-CoA:carnitine CoA-transferase CaiB-like acyl-CoA transferase